MKEEYKTICDKCYQKTWYETEQPCKRTIFDGCQECGSHEYISKEHLCEGTLRVIDNSKLDSRLTPYYESGERVEVTYKWGEVERFYVGKSTGWKPIYITIKRRNSIAGGGVLSNDSITSVRGLGIYK